MMPLTPVIANGLRRLRSAHPVAPETMRDPGAIGPASAIVATLIGVILAAVSPAAAGSAKSTPAHATAAASDLTPDGRAPDKVVKSGRQTSVATVWDCSLPNYAPVVSARVEHGSVAVVTGNGPNCGRALMSLTDILYRPNPGFRGIDKLTVLGFLTHGDIDRTFTILVK